MHAVSGAKLHSFYQYFHKWFSRYSQGKQLQFENKQTLNDFLMTDLQ